MRIIPDPYFCKELEGGLDWRKVGSWQADERFAEAAEIMRPFFPAGEGEPAVHVDYDKGIAEEGYELEVKPGGVYVKASSASGVLYAFSSLRIHSGADLGKNRMRAVRIKDKPKVHYRGLLLDVARYFASVDEVKKIIDLMLLLKLNVLHLHLTDDQGWRVEIKKYPLLTQVGAKREKTNIGCWQSTADDGTPHEGFYTQDDVRDLVAYAAARGITIVPEIDMPAHFTSAFAAYPWLACREVEGIKPAWFMGGKYPESIGWEDWNRSACMGKESTFEFIFGVLDEICELFPGPFIHIGGDEAPKEEWKKCPLCQKRKKELGLKTEKQLQGYFTNRVYEYVKGKGKQLIGWNEVLGGKNLDKDVVVQYWTALPDRKVKKHIKKGGRVILSKHEAFYFDMPYAQYPLKNTYTFTPKQLGIGKKYEKNILGYEGCLWAEWTPTLDKREFQLFPRAEALAEISWNTRGVNEEKFLKAKDDFARILRALGVTYACDEIAQISDRKKRKEITSAWYQKDTNVEYNMQRSEASLPTQSE